MHTAFWSVWQRLGASKFQRQELTWWPISVAQWCNAPLQSPQFCRYYDGPNGLWWMGPEHSEFGPQNQKHFWWWVGTWFLQHWRITVWKSRSVTPVTVFPFRFSRSWFQVALVVVIVVIVVVVVVVAVVVAIELEKRQCDALCNFMLLYVAVLFFMFVFKRFWKI